MKKIITWYLTRLLRFIPLVVFIYTYRLQSDWQPAFIAGGTVALATILLAFSQKKPQDTVLVAINCFLIGGAAMYLFDITWLKNVYDQYLEATLFIWYFIVGVMMTLFSRGGFIGIYGLSRRLTLKLSLMMLFGTVGAILISWYFKGDFIKAGWLPFVLLLLWRQLVIRTQVRALNA